MREVPTPRLGVNTIAVPIKDLVETHPKVGFLVMEKLVRIVRTADDRMYLAKRGA